MASHELISNELLALNQESLAKIHSEPHSALLVDVHGFLYTSSYETEPHIDNSTVSTQLAELAAMGLPIAAVTGFGDRIHLAFTNPLREQLKRMDISIENLPIFLSTRNGALTTHAFTDELIAGYPIDPAVYLEITNHELVRAINNLTSDEIKANLQKEYASTQRDLGLQVHPFRNQNPGLRHDWHNGSKAGYQLTAIYEPEVVRQVTFGDEKWNDAATIFKYAGGIPNSAQEMARVLQQELDGRGLHLSLHTAASHPEIDISVGGVDKSTGVRVLARLIANYWGITEEEVYNTAVAGGDSPFQNDGPLLELFQNQITNVVSAKAIDKGIVCLDYPGITDQIGRTSHFLSQFQVFSR